jgi:hypothetical protein
MELHMTKVIYAHVREDIRPICEASNSTRAKYIKGDRFIPYPRVEIILNEIDFLITQPPQPRATGIVVMGGPGAGKTTIAMATMRRVALLPSFVEGVPQQRIVSITMTGAREARMIYNQILEALGSPVKSGMRPEDQESLVFRLLAQAGTRLLIVDEIQDLINSTKRQALIALDTIKLLMNKQRLAVLALGVPKAAEAMMRNEHLNTRFKYMALTSWKANDDARDLLAALEEALPLRKPSHLDSPAMTKLIVKQGKGVLSNIVRLVNDAALWSIVSGQEFIDEELISKAFESAPPATVFGESLPVRNENVVAK